MEFPNMSDINLVNGVNPSQPFQLIIRNDQTSTYNKGGWTHEEDRRLSEVARRYENIMSWTEIAKLVGGRNVKQCRERWYTNLRPGINKGLWTPAEEIILRKAHAELGNKWVEISRRLPGRTNNFIKNHWNSKQRRLQFPMDYNCASGSGNQNANLQIYARTVSTQESSTNDIASDFTQVKHEEKNPRNFDLNELPVDDDE